MIKEINVHLAGWCNYFNYGYPRNVFRQINSYVRFKLTKHLQRRSQRPMQPAQGVTYYKHLKDLGLGLVNDILASDSVPMKSMGEPYAGNLHVRFDELSITHKFHC